MPLSRHLDVDDAERELQALVAAGPPVPYTKALLDGISGELFAVMGARPPAAPASPRSSTRWRAGSRAATSRSTGSRLRAISAYAMQEDLLYPMLTVRATLLFAAELTVHLPRIQPNSFGCDAHRAPRSFHSPSRSA